jgi:hypothetical protein
MKTMVRRCSCCSRKQLRLHLGADDRIERREGLVHQEDRRVGGQRARQAHALLHAAGKFVGVAVAPARQAHLRERLVGLREALFLARARELQAERGVLAHRHVRHQRERLEHHADVLAAQRAQLGVGVFVDVGAVDHDAARGRLDQPVQEAHQRRLARARQAHDHEDLAGLDLEGGIEHADRLARLREDFLLRKTLPHQFEGLFGRIAEHLENMVDENSFGHTPGLLV